MGTTESKPKIINQKLNLRYDNLNIKDLDTFFNSAFPAVREVEIIRCGFINRWNEFVRLSGGIVLKNPRFESCVQGMLWKLSADMNGNLSSLDILENEPFIVFKNTNFLKDEDIQISQSFQELCRFYFNNYPNVVRLESELKRLDKETRAYNKDPEDILNERNVSPMDMFSYKRRLNVNSKHVCYAYEVIYEIRSYFEDIKKGLERFSTWMKNPEQIKKFEEVGSLAKGKNLSRPAKIVYKYSKEEKLREYEDHFDLIQDDLKAEKEARSILDLNTRKITVISTTLQPLSEEKNVILTDQSAHKDTAESLTEVIRPKISETATEIITTQKLPVEPFRENVIERREVKIQPSYTQDYETVEYNGRLAQSNLLRPSRTISTDEKPMLKSYVIDNETFPGRGTIITHTEVTETSDNEKLRQEAEDLRRTNEELNYRLGSTNYTSGIAAQDQIKLQSTISPIESVSESSKCPTGLKHNIPIKSWNFLLQKIVRPSQTEIGKFSRIVPLTDQNLLATGTKKGYLILWRVSDINNIKEEKVLSISPNNSIRSLVYLNDGKTLICGSEDGKISKINIENLDQPIEKICDLSNPVNAIVYTANGFSVLAASDKKIYEIDIVKNKVLSFTEAHDNTITDLAFNPLKELYVSCAEDNAIKIWNAKTKECLGILQGHSAPVISICFAYSSDHIYLVSIAKDSFITFWNLTNRNFTRTYELSDMPTNVFYLWDKKTVLATHKNGVFTLWDLERDESKDFSNERVAYHKGCYLNDGHNVVLSSADGTLEFWSAN